MNRQNDSLSRRLDREAAELRRRVAEMDRAKRVGGVQLTRQEFERRLASGKLDRSKLNTPGTLENTLARAFKMTTVGQTTVGQTSKRETAVAK